MKAIVCEMCGSNDFIKQEGVYVCQNCGTKYTAEEAKNLLVEVTGKVKIDTSDELNNLYILARRARNDKNNENAQKYYEQILIKDPSSWEATFYSTYFQSMNCTLGEVNEAANRICNCEETVFNLIKDNVIDAEERLKIVDEVASNLISISESLFNWSKNYYNGIDEQIRNNNDLRDFLIDGLATKDIVYNGGDWIVKIFGDNYGDIAVRCWKMGVSQHSILYDFFKDKNKHANIIKDYIDKIDKYSKNEEGNEDTNNVPKENQSLPTKPNFKAIAVLLIAVLAMFFIMDKLFFSSSSSEQSNATESIKRTDTFMNGDPEESIQRILGKPFKISESQADKETTRRYSYDGVTFTTKAGKINYINKDLKIINDAPIKRGDKITKIRWYRGAPLRYEQNLIQANDVDLVKYNLYEYADYAVITQAPKFENNSEFVVGFLPKGAYKINTLDFNSDKATDNWKYTMRFLEVLVPAIHYYEKIEPKVKILEISSPVIEEIPLKVAEGNNNSATASQPSVTAAQNPVNSNGATVSSQGSEEHYPGTDFYPPGSMRDRITGTGVNMRSGPGLEHNVIGSFDKGEIVVEIDNQMSKKDSWVQVRRKNGEVGWVSGQYCELVKDPKINYSKYINAVGALYDYHEAITKKDYKKAYNLLGPEIQKTTVPPDQYGQGYSDVISSTVMETYPRSTDGSTVSVEYLFEAKDKTPSGISVKYYKGFADLQKLNGEWKIVQESVGRGNVDRKTLLR